MSITRRTSLKAAAAAALVIASRPVAAATERPSAASMVLAGVYDERIDPGQCLVSEKYDGVRAFWDGRRLLHRSGRAVAAPGWFVERLPADEALDGELWFGRGRFDALSAAVRREPPDDAEWRRVRYMVFELPGAAGSFAERALSIERIATQTGWSQLQAAPQSRVADRAALRRRLAETVAEGGEGLMLHIAAAPYQPGRSDLLTKLKPQLDAEATVVGYRRGKGKYVGEIGALQVETPHGRRFFIGTGLPDAVRREPPALGSVVSYRYHALTPQGVPRFASYWRVHQPL
jgi:DNA ligase-1